MSNEGEVVVDEVIDQPIPEQTVDDSATDTEQGEGEQEVKEKPAEPAIPKGVQRRIDRAVRQKYEAEARAKMLEERLTALEQYQRQSPQVQNSIDNSEPKIENFDDFDSFVAAKAEWIAARKIEETLTDRERRQMADRESRARQELSLAWQKRVSEATVELPDFEDVIASSEVPMTGQMQQAIMESDVGPKLAYYLATNPDEAIQISKMSPVGAIRALGRIEERLSSRPVKKSTSAPEPVKPVGSRATVKKDPGQMTDAEYAKWRKSGKA